MKCLTQINRDNDSCRFPPNENYRLIWTMMRHCWIVQSFDSMI